MALTNLLDMTGKTIVISGASGGIGSAAVRACAALGADLILTDQRPIGELPDLDEAGVRYSTHLLDNTDRAAVEAFAAGIGTIHALADCAGGYFAGDWQSDDWADLLHRTIGANVVGPMNLVRALLPKLSANGGGQIVILGSIAARTAGSSVDAEPAYTASKGAIHSLIRALARRTARDNVVVNGIAPGPVMTPMLAGTQLGFDVSGFPLRRLAEPSEIGWPVAFLCSPAASYINGVVMDINGGTSFS